MHCKNPKDPLSCGFNFKGGSPGSRDCAQAMKMKPAKCPSRIRAGWVIDGTGGPARRNVLLLVQSGRIRAMPPFPPDEPVPEDTVDLAGHTLIPGLVDAHVHLCMSGTPDPETRSRQMHAGYDDIRPMIEAHIKEHLRRGVIAVRDGGDSTGHALRFRLEDLPRSGLPILLKCAGRARHAPGRYGGLIGRPPMEGAGLDEDIRRDGRPSDHIKIINSGINSLTRFGNQTRPQFAFDEMRRAVLASRELDLPVMVHANGRVPVLESVEAGCASVEHGFFMGMEPMSRMAGLGTTWVPTACTMSGYAGILPMESPEARGAVRILEHQLEQMRHAIRLSVPMAVGTDSGSPGVHHGLAVAEEMGLFMKAGMDVEEAVQCASSRGARLLGAENELGLLKEDMPATFVVLKGPPGGMPQSLREPAAVCVRGEFLEP